MKEISPINFFKTYQKENNLRVIDVREPFDFDHYHLTDSTNIPGKLLMEKHYLFLNKKYEYFIICKDGQLSKKITSYLDKYGYNVINVIGGIDHWIGSYNKKTYY